ncbi:MAG: type II secretion system F family protein [Candidatus Omnitrophica bacterium]|nr:type II secretion system F family protein [Candidatus Omnitrophota bacterium]
MEIILLIFIFIAIVAGVYFVMLPWAKRDNRMLPQRFKVTQSPLAGLRKILQGVANIIKPLEKFLPAAGINKRLIWAGSPLNILEFFAFKFLMIIVVPVIGIVLLQKTDLISLVIFILVGYLLPDFWLKQQIQKRQRQISRDLPAVIDLLTLCVGAGLNFMLAMDRVVKDFKKCPLTAELSATWQEIQMGRTRQEALKALAQRVGVAEISSFSRTLVQADRMGSPIGEALNILSDDIRTRRFLRGEEMALKAPIKLLFPLLFFILPVVLIIVGGPVVLQFLKGGGLKF